MNNQIRQTLRWFFTLLMVSVLVGFLSCSTTTKEEASTMPPNDQAHTNQAVQLPSPS